MISPRTLWLAFAPFLSPSLPRKRVRLLPPSLSPAAAAGEHRSIASGNGDQKIFGGTVCKTATDKEWFQATDAKFQAWPRVAGPPVIMNPISRQNFIVKDP
ncbi:hypothetical protein VPH35_069826 [Triticum aestivum]